MSECHTQINSRTIIKASKNEIFNIELKTWSSFQRRSAFFQIHYTKYIKPASFNVNFIDPRKHKYCSFNLSFYQRLLKQKLG